MIIKQEIIDVRQMGPRGWNYQNGIRKYNISRNGTARLNAKFDFYKRMEIVREKKFDVEVERIYVRAPKKD